MVANFIQLLPQKRLYATRTQVVPVWEPALRQ